MVVVILGSTAGVVKDMVDYLWCSSHYSFCRKNETDKFHGRKLPVGDAGRFF